MEHIFSPKALLEVFSRAGVTSLPAGFAEGACLHLSEVYRWNRVHDLTAVPASQALLRHTLDSVLPLVRTPAPGTLLDIGSGAGFPGVVLALWWPTTRVTLCEPLRKRRSFLETVCAKLNLNVELLASPVEEVHGRTWDMVTTRATLPFATLMQSALPVTRVGGTLEALCGPEAAPVLTEGTLPGWDWVRRTDYSLPDGAGRCLISALKSAT